MIWILETLVVGFGLVMWKASLSKAFEARQSEGAARPELIRVAMSNGH